MKLLNLKFYLFFNNVHLFPFESAKSFEQFFLISLFNNVSMTIILKKRMFNKWILFLLI